MWAQSCTHRRSMLIQTSFVFILHLDSEGHRHGFFRIKNRPGCSPWEGWVWVRGPKKTPPPQAHGPPLTHSCILLTLSMLSTFPQGKFLCCFKYMSMFPELLTLNFLFPRDLYQLRVCFRAVSL